MIGLCVKAIQFKRFSDLYIVPARRPQAGNFYSGLATFQTYKPSWLLRIFSNVIVIQLLGL